MYIATSRACSLNTGAAQAMVKPRTKTKASALKDSVQDTPYGILTERDERAEAKQPSKLSSKSFFGKDVPQPEPAKALLPLSRVLRGCLGKALMRFLLLGVTKQPTPEFTRQIPKPTVGHFRLYVPREGAVL